MDHKFNSLFCVLSFFLLIGLVTSSSSFISNDALEAHAHYGRALLQLKTACNVSFQDMDYSVITTKCKGPMYPAEQCCNALKEFACPYRDAINDENSDCASTMFSYINLYGKYPPGLFANECKEGKNGLDCEQVDKEKSSKSSAARALDTRPSLLVLVTGAIALFFRLF